MPKFTHSLSASVSALLLILGSASAEAREKGGKDGGPFMEKIQALGLTPEQKTKVMEIRKEGREAMKSIRTEAKAAREKLATAVKTDAPKAELEKLFAAAQAKRQEIAQYSFAQAMKIRELLTPDQRKKAGDLMSQFIEKKKNWKNRHGKGGPGKAGGSPDAADDGDEE